MDEQDSAGVIKTFGPDGFTTAVVKPDPQLGYVHQSSRRYRKTMAAAFSSQTLQRPHEASGAIQHIWLQWWVPRHLSWWIAVLFMLGSAHFALASAVTLWPAASALSWLKPHWLGGIYFVGSIFFTSAAYLQWLQALNCSLDKNSLQRDPQTRQWRWFGWQGNNLGYLASSVQLAGTLLFNFDTGDALIAGLHWQLEDVVVWTPNFIGSIAFLAASQLAVMEYSHASFSFRPADISWYIVMINLLGSILFMLSALTSFVSPGDSYQNAWLSNMGTFTGALCFLIAAYLLIPEFLEKE